MPRPHLFGLLPEDLEALLAEAGVPVRPAETRRLLAHVIAHGRDGFPTARPLPARLETEIAARFDRQPLMVVDRAADPQDGFVKLLLRLPDGEWTEAVRIPLEARGRFSVCLSTQVGCAMGCAFCATGRLGFRRNLEAWEMVAAFLAVRADLEHEAEAEGLPPGRVTGAVFMGQGEPFANYDAVIQAARVLSHPCGGRVSAEAISISTVGLVPQIRRYTAEKHPFRLVVSLTSTVPERRERLLPAAARQDLDALAAALADHARDRGDRVMVVWVMLSGVNLDQREVDGLRRLLGGVPLRLSILDVNDPRPDGFRPPDRAELDAFRDALRTLGVPVVRRYSGGASRDAACGMLAAKAAGHYPGAPA